MNISLRRDRLHFRSCSAVIQWLPLLPHLARPTGQHARCSPRSRAERREPESVSKAEALAVYVHFRSRRTTRKNYDRFEDSLKLLRVVNTRTVNDVDNKALSMFNDAGRQGLSRRMMQAVKNGLFDTPNGMGNKEKQRPNVRIYKIKRLKGLPVFSLNS